MCILGCILVSTVLAQEGRLIINFLFLFLTFENNDHFSSDVLGLLQDRGSITVRMVV